MKRNQVRVLSAIYMATDCSNDVYDYAMLHYTQRAIAEAMPDLVTWIDGCVPVDGDGFAPGTYREGRGYRLTNAGYEALTRWDSAKWPHHQRRFYTKPASGGEGGG